MTHPACRIRPAHTGLMDRDSTSPNGSGCGDFRRTYRFDGPSGAVLVQRDWWRSYQSGRAGEDHLVILHAHPAARVLDGAAGHPRYQEWAAERDRLIALGESGEYIPGDWAELPEWAPDDVRAAWAAWRPHEDARPWWRRRPDPAFMIGTELAAWGAFARLMSRAQSARRQCPA